MTYYHHWFEEFVKSKHICVNFFQMNVHFRTYLIVWMVWSSQILLDCVGLFELRFYWKYDSSSFLDDRDMKLRYEVRLFITLGVKRECVIKLTLRYFKLYWNNMAIEPPFSKNSQSEICSSSLSGSFWNTELSVSYSNFYFRHPL